MEQQTREFCGFCVRIPRTAKVFYTLAILASEEKIFRLLSLANLSLFTVRLAKPVPANLLVVLFKCNAYKAIGSLGSLREKSTR